MPTLPWGLVTGSPSTRISPVLGASRPEIIFRSVDLPQPDGPTTTKNSPSLMWKSSGRSDGTSPSRDLYVFDTPESVIPDALLPAARSDTRRRCAPAWSAADFVTAFVTSADTRWYKMPW